MKAFFSKAKWITCIAIFFAITAKAQNPLDSTFAGWEPAIPNFTMGCGTMKLMVELPDSSVTKIANYENTMVYKQGGVLPPQSSSNYVIPVVFHIISNNINYLSYQQIEWQINALNAAYANQYATYNGVGGAGANAVNTNISFCLAKNYEGVSGWTNSNEPGVMRYSQATTYSVANSSSGMSSIKGIVHPSGIEFPSTNYLNIYLVDNITSTSGTTIGFATFPNMGMPIDGVVFRQDCVGDNSLPNGFYIFGGTIGLQQGKVMAHEVGHFLGLYHTFEICTNGALPSPYPTSPVWSCLGVNGTTCSSEGDLVCDTPPTTINGNSCGTTSNTCTDALPAYSNADQNDQLENFMCYSGDVCLNTFTALQAARMYSAIDNNYVTTGTAPRVTLVSPANLVATGVMGPNGCAQQILTAVFNYSPHNPCSGTAVSFVTPVGPALSANSWSWNFGDGGSSTSTNPVHTFTANGQYYVILAATNTVTSQVAFYTTLVTIGDNVTLSAQSTGSVCIGSTQALLLHFTGTPPFTATVSNGINTYTVGTAYFDVTIPVTITANTTYSLTAATNSSSCPSVLSGVASYTAVNCCPNIIQNGDFSAGNTSFTSDNSYYCINQFPGVYCVGTFTNTVMPWATLNVPTHGNALYIDGISTPPSGAIANVWKQNLTLTPNTDYEFGFSSTGNNPPAYISGGYILQFQVVVTDLTSGSIYNLNTSPIEPVTQTTYSTDPQNWQTFAFNWHTPPLLSNNCSVSIQQINSFGAGGYDYQIDDIYMETMNSNLTANAGSPITICKGGSALLSATATGTTTTSTYSWSPATGLSSAIILNPIASPTTTTVYTLTVTGDNLCSSTSTTTVTVTSTTTTPITVTPTSTNVCSGSTVTLTASGSSTYTWSTTAQTNTISVSPSSTTIYTVNSTASNGCKGIATSTVNITPSMLIAGNTSICSGTTTTLTASGATSYTWSTGATTNSVSVSPSSTTSYTLTGNNTVCTSTMVVTVSVTASPTISVAGNFSICIGQSTTLTASGATNYGWNTGSTGNTLVVNPTSTTNYTVVGTNTSGCAGTKTVTVVASTPPNITGVSTNYQICNGGWLNLSAGGASSYSWSPGGVTTSTINLTPTSTTAYTLTGTTAGCAAVKTFTVTVNPHPTLTVSASPLSFCSGGTSTLSVIGANSITYVWTPTTALTCTNCPNPVASPTTNITYSVTGSLQGCVSNTGTVSLSVASACTGTPMTTTITSSGTFTSNPGLINSNIIIKSPASYTITTPELRILPSYSITVKSGATLVISGSWLHACSCPGQMWQGIYVENGGTIIVNNYSIIEDAVQAIATASGTTTLTPVWNISSCIFNKNGTGIYVNSQTQNLSNNYIYNTIFTCRTLESTSPTSGIFSHIKAHIGVATPSMPSTTNPTATTLAGQRSQYGVYLNQTTYSASVNIGNSAQGSNLFDYNDNGVYGIGATMTIKNNVFQNFTGNSNPSNTVTIGVGVYENDNGIKPIPKIIVGNGSTTVVAAEKNYFTNCLRGVFTTNSQNLYINNNTFSNESTASTFTISGTHVIGEFGVVNTKFAVGSNTTTPEQLQYANNTCQNYATAFGLDFRKVYNTTSQGIYLYNNVINGAGTSTKYTNYGIFLQQSTAFGANTGVPQDMLTITTNSITNVNTSCISLNTVNTGTVSGFVTIKQNTELSLLYQNYASLQSPRIAVIGIYSSPYTKVDDNAIIKCTGMSTYTTTNTQNIAGIYTTTSPLCTINCNTVTCVGEGFVFEGGSPTSTWRANTTTTGKYGLVLRTNGYMGNQGGVNNAIMTTFGNYGSQSLISGQTLCDGSNPTNTVTPAALYVNTGGFSCPNSNSTDYFPCTNNQIGGVAYSTTTTPVGLITTAAATVSPCLGSGGGGGGGGSGAVIGGSAMNTSTTNSNATPAPTSADLQNLIAPGADLPNYNTETRWANQYYVNSTDASIAAASGYENAKTFALADAAYMAGKYSQAKTLVNSVSPINIIETNWKDVSSILLAQATKANYVLTSADIATLQNVAEQCPTTGGTIVYKARTALNSFYNNIIEYHYDCDLGGNNNRVANTVEIAETENQMVNLYPNPNNGTMMLDYTIKADASLEISDLSGRLVGTYVLPATGTHVEVKNNELYNGVYIYRVVSNGVVIKIGKIVVMQ